MRRVKALTGHTFTLHLLIWYIISIIIINKPNFICQSRPYTYLTLHVLRHISEDVVAGVHLLSSLEKDNYVRLWCHQKLTSEALYCLKEKKIIHGFSFFFESVRIKQKTEPWKEIYLQACSCSLNLACPGPWSRRIGIQSRLGALSWFSLKTCGLQSLSRVGQPMKQLVHKEGQSRESQEYWNISRISNTNSLFKKFNLIPFFNSNS